MLLLSDGHNTGICATYPFPNGLGFYTRFTFHDRERRISTSPIFTALNVGICLAFVFLLITNPEATDFNVFFCLAPLLPGLLKNIIQKRRDMNKHAIKVVGIAPNSVWIEHLTACSSIVLAFIWMIQVQGNDGVGLAPPLIFIFIYIVIAAWPFVNLAYYKRTAKQW
jgi:hypothetical protein